jgi:hypothetical protein
MGNILEILKEYSSPPAKSQQQWKLFAIVYAVQNGTRKGGTPTWYGKSSNKDPGMIGMMVKKIPNGEVKKFLNVDPGTLPKYVDGEDHDPKIDKMYKDMKKSQSSGDSAKRKRKRGYKKAAPYWKKPIKYATSKTDPGMRDSLERLRPIIVEEIKKVMKEAMSSTERMRRYNKKHPKKVKQNLKKTQDDRVERNKSHGDKTEEYGTELMRNKDVHHPNGVNGKGSKVVNKDHGRDIKK